jgi:hypothetical protein
MAPCIYRALIFLPDRYAMPKISGPFYVYKRRDTKKYHITLYPASGLPLEACKNWQRKGFSRLPLELTIFRDPKKKSDDAGARALIDYLKNQLKGPDVAPQEAPQTGGKPPGPAVGAWLKRFTSLDDNPRAARLISEGSPYSPDTLALYKMNFHAT